jgi:TRAP transporter 4TM/12TM fusion protein
MQPADPTRSDLSSRDALPAVRGVVYWLGAAIAAAHLYLNTLATWPELWTSAFHFAAFGALCALLRPAWQARRASVRRAVLGLDVGLAVAGGAAVGYLIAAEDALYARGVEFVWADWAAAAVAIVLALEYARRATGWVVPALIVIALTYVVAWGQLVGGVLHFPGLSWETLFYRSFFGAEGMFGPIARISSTTVFMFILFGAFLLRSGGGEFIVNLARAAAGRVVGGPGLVAVIASGLGGMISGSAVANTVSTGMITIPLMKKSGLPPKFAAGVEAAASTGGQLMPPVMGAGVFVMASITQIPYLHIIALALAPAILYFLSIAIWVRIEARRRGLVPATDEDALRLPDVLRRGGVAFLAPVGVLVGLLVVGFTPTFAAGTGIAAVVAASWLSPRPMGPRAVLDALALGARNMVSTAVLLVAVGLIVNVVTTTGLGNTVSLMIAEWSGGSLLLMLVLVALASLVLGMGLPVTAAYIVLATLSAPALYELIARDQLIATLIAGGVPEAARDLLGVLGAERVAEMGSAMNLEAARALVAELPPELRRGLIEHALSPAALTAALLSAHMIVFWLSQDSNVTPPVCLTAFAAAAIAGTHPLATGFTAWRIAKGLYVIPILFAYTPLLAGDPLAALEITGFALLGLYGLSAALAGFAEARLGWPARLLVGAAGVALLWPGILWLHLAGALALAGVLALNLRTSRS